MNPARSILLRRATCLLFAGMLVAEGWWLQRSRESARRAMAKLAERRQEGDRLARLSPVPTAATERALASELSDRGRDLAGLRATWAPRGLGGERERAKPMEAFFGITNFVENSRAQAERAQVKTRAEECFGFASHRHEGPAAEFAATVSRQCAALQYLVGTLFDAQPQAVLAVRRERPLPENEEGRRGPPGRSQLPRMGASSTGDQADDFFEWAERPLRRTAARIRSDAFQLEFSGQTPVLRNFLNRLAADDRPIIVRRVEAIPLDEHDPAGRSGAKGSGPLVAQGLTRFTVVVESIELAPATNEPAP